MSETANFESAQALFCAIADKVGSDGSGKIDKVFNPSDNRNDQVVLNNWKKRIKKIQ